MEKLIWNNCLIHQDLLELRGKSNLGAYSTIYIIYLIQDFRMLSVWDYSNLRCHLLESSAGYFCQFLTISAPCCSFVYSRHLLLLLHQSLTFCLFVNFVASRNNVPGQWNFDIIYLWFSTLSNLFCILVMHTFSLNLC